MNTSGNVGIGIANPEEKLHINGDVFLTYGKSLWIGNNYDGLSRLRLHHSGYSAYVDYYTNLYFRSASNTSSNRFVFTSQGYLGINRTSPSYHLDVNGIVRALNVSVSSDIRLKKNIVKLGKQKDKLAKLQGLSYTLNDQLFRQSSDIHDANSGVDTSELRPFILDKKLTGKKQLGFSTQDLQAVFPELVTADEKGYLSVNYIGLIPVIVEAFKEQQSEIESLRREMAISKNLKNATSIINFSADLTENILYQNAPNPFSQSTVIKYSLENDASDAKICVYGLNGNQLKCYLLEHGGYGSITIFADELTAGMYYYSLIADATLIGTERMVLTD